MTVNLTDTEAAFILDALDNFNEAFNRGRAFECLAQAIANSTLVEDHHHRVTAVTSAPCNLCGHRFDHYESCRYAWAAM